MGGVIVGGKSDHTGAMGGGICSASTTMFNAAATAGLQIDERHAHYYYINRYPVGRDATVLSDGATTWDLRWTNDTPYPVLIRAWTTYGSKSTITIQIWSVEKLRNVTWTGGGMANIVYAHNNPPQYVSTLKPGQVNIAEYATNGFDTGVTRKVTDLATGAVVHSDVWYSHYTAVNGQVQIGGAPPATPAPTGAPTAPAPTSGAWFLFSPLIPSGGAAQRPSSTGRPRVSLGPVLAFAPGAVQSAGAGARTLWGCVVSTGAGYRRTRAEVPSGLVKQAAQRSNWQQPACSRPRRLGSKVSVEAASPPWAVEASLSGGAIPGSVA